jgi:hypothetical protein
MGVSHELKQIQYSLSNPYLWSSGQFDSLIITAGANKAALLKNRKTDTRGEKTNL